MSSITKSSNNSKGRVNIIQSIQTPLGFFSLIILVTEAILGLLAVKAAGSDFTILMVAMVGIMLLSIMVVALIAYKRPIILTKGHNQHIELPEANGDGVFISSPMAGFGDDEKFQNVRQDMMRLVEIFRLECNFQFVYYAGQNIQSIKDFDLEDIALEKDINALKKSKYFIMIYPDEIVSSVLFEAGWAQSMGKSSIYFVRDENHLPFLMKKAAQAIETVKIYRYEDIDDIIRIIQKHKNDLFKEKEDIKSAD